MPELVHDELEDNGNIPYQIYVRDLRRIEGTVTLTDANVTPFMLGDGRRPVANGRRRRDWRLDGGVAGLCRRRTGRVQVSGRLYALDSVRDFCATY